MNDSEKVVQECAFPVIIHGVPIPCGRCAWCLEQRRKGSVDIRPVEDLPDKKRFSEELFKISD